MDPCTRAALPGLVAALLLIAEAGPAQCGARARVELLSAAPAVRPGQPLLLGLRVTVEPRWHTYWRNPGDAGMAPRISWDLPDGFAIREVEWPYPKRFEEEGIATFGYEGAPTLLATLVPPQDLAGTTAATVGVRVDLLVCREVCVPDGGEARLTLPVAAGGGVGAEPAWLTAARAAIPAVPARWTFRARQEGQRITLSIVPPDDSPLKNEPPVFFPQTRDLLDYTARAGYRRVNAGAELDLHLSALAMGIPSRLEGVLVPANGADALAVNVPIEREGKIELSP